MLLLLRAAVDGAPGGGALDRPASLRLATAALAAMAVSADQFADGEAFAASAMALGTLGQDRTVSKPPLSMTVRRLLLIDRLLRERADESAAANAWLDDIHDATNRLVTAAMSAFTDPHSIDAIAMNSLPWLGLYLAYGIFPHQPLARGLRRAAVASVRSRAGTDPRAIADLIFEQAMSLLDKADSASAEGRTAARFADVLAAAHEALPLYAASVQLLDDVATVSREQGCQPDPDIKRERGPAEESRVACIELLTGAGATWVSQLASHALLGQKGKPAREVIETSVRQTAARLPFFPSRLLAKWQEAAREVPANASIPYGDAAGDLLGRLARVLFDSFIGAFEDAVVIEAADEYRNRFASLFPRPCSGALAEWSDEEIRRRPDEQKAALQHGRTLLERNEFDLAVSALSLARSSHDAATRDAATILLSTLKARHEKLPP